MSNPNPNQDPIETKEVKSEHPWRDKRAQSATPLKSETIKPPKRNNKEIREKIKTDKFAITFIKNGGNQADAYRKTVGNDKMSSKSASEAGGRMLDKAIVKKTIVDLLPRDNKHASIIKQAFKANRPQDITWKELHAYLRTSLELKGELNTQSKAPNVNIGLVVQR